MSARKATQKQPMALNAAAIAAATHLSPVAVTEFLEEDARRGLVVREAEGWRLSDTAERAYGRALRGLGDGAIFIGSRSRPRLR